MIAVLLIISGAYCQTLAPLEPAGGKILFGPWYNRVDKDTPFKTQERVKVPPFSLFQSDMDIGQTLKNAEDIMQTADQIAETKTDAIMYLTIYPKDGFEAVSDSALQAFVAIVKHITDSGRRMMIRYASEMNGSCISS
jgi:hypothetical protein